MLKTIRVSCLLLAGIASSGCAEFAARGAARASQIEQAWAGYVSDVNGYRRQIRQKCVDILMRQTDDLIQSGEHDQARALLEANYPDPVAIGAVKDALDKDKMPFGEAIGCQRVEGDAS